MPSQPDTPRTFVTLAYAARHVNALPAHVGRLADQGLITVRKLPGSRRRVLLDDVVRVVERSTLAVDSPAGGDS